MNMTNTVSDFAARLGQTLKGMVKIALNPAPPTISKVKDAESEPLIILANGPSLRKVIDEHADSLSRSRTLAVNFAACAPEFFTLKPDYYVLADPHFFRATADENVSRLLANLSAVSWPMRLIVDRRYRRLLDKAVTLPENVRVETFIGNGVEGFGWFENLAYGSGHAMPRPRNVLIPSIMAGIMLGYKTIYICGADHSWMQDLHVTDDNEVVSGMNHFYKESQSEVKRSKNEYRGYRLHQILLSYYTAFLSYHKIERYARRRSIDIFNATPGSYIDAFRRRQIPNL